MNLKVENAVSERNVLANGSKRSKAQSAYHRLLDMILSGELAPGEHLSESDLVQILKTGRTPFREAIQRLAEQKMVLVAPRRTPQVAPIMYSDLASIPEARRIIEVPAAGLAAERATAAERNELEAANEAFKRSLRDGDTAMMIAADGHLHEVVAAASHNNQLADAVSRLNTQSYRILYLAAIGNRELGGLDVDVHNPIVNAIVSGDSAAAQKAMSAHNVEFTDRIRNITKTQAALQA